MEEIIEKVANNLSDLLYEDVPSGDFDGLVGMENHIMQISSLLSLDSDDVRMVGIWGPSGIGKTTTARALYRKLSSNFTHTAFMESIKAIREEIHTDDHAYMLYLQEKLLCQTFNHMGLEIHHLGVAEKRLKDKKVLVVLDDVDDLKQLKAMAKKTQWFGNGSRIIITTTDKKLLKAHGINDIYHVEFPCASDALEILCLHAFGQKSPYLGFEELAMDVTQLAGDLPLGLSVFGSYLRGRSEEEWTAALPRFRTSLVPELKDILRCDYEALWDKDKYLFLHIACFFNGKKTTNMVKHLSNLDVTHGLQILTEKSLISIDKDGRLVMHSLLEQLGKEIAHKEYRDEYGRCKFVVDAGELGDSIEGSTYKGIVDPFKGLSPFPSRCSHQVFPSFCGVDVRKAFLTHTLKEFKNKGITVFTDNNDIKRSMSIGPELKEAIKGSRVSIVIVSKNYASSTWCLDELVLIMKCREELGQIVMTMFYDVEPTDVKKQTGYFGSVFESTCVGKSVEDVERWKQALKEVATIAGFDSTIWKNEAEMIENVATDISNKLNMATASRDFDGLVGMENHITQISSMLSLDSNDVRMVGILGPAGIGKTTIARALYNKLSNSFTHTAFMESIRGSGERTHSDDYAFMLHLQEQFLSKTFNHKDLKIHHLGVAEERLKDKKVLLVLDDVVDLKQLKAMAGNSQWFGCGSRIIMTTKAARLLEAHGIDHIYHVGLPSLAQAYEIFCLYAFGQKFPYDGYEDLAMEVTGLAGDLPLGLRVFGSHLRGMSKEEWIEALPRLRTSLDGDIEKVLRFSYEALCDKDKDLFLHIACLFEGESISYLEKCLAHSDLDVRHGLKVLANNSLISITEEERLVMHNLVEQLGKEIVRQEHKDEPERRKFLVDAREICDVLTDNTGSKSVLGIDLDIMAIKDELCIDKRAFEGMTRLQFLRFKSPYGSGKNNKLILPQGLNNLPRKLRLLCWDEFPLRCLPPDFAAEFLVILEMRNSSIEKLWEGSPLMDMSYSLKLKDIPNVSNATNLETLILNGCESLVEIPTWFKNLSRLTHLKMVGCKKLKDLPTNINMESLYHLDLSHCTQLKTFPEISTRIGYLDLENTGIEEVPSSIRSWPDFAKLSMRGCKSLRMFPDVLDSMEELN
ncbi:disease resistance-like protein DSC2 [Brassica napus]|uniref:disease resistance-like protein DSC2 n=1 Tax=Brassica napus TaxID=3708 RepID=UPI002078AE85|nr:disease resistance-like protein DSC2 [Brassica napus]